MCSKGNPSTTTAQQQATNSSQASNTQGEQTQAGFSQLGPNPDTLALYNNFLQGVGAIQGAPFDANMMQQTVPWTAGQDAASNYQIGLGMQGMPYASNAAALLNQGAQSTVGQIPGVASSLLSPWAGQAVNYGVDQGQAISDYAKNLAAQGPQLQQFSQGAIDQYMSPYINDVVNATQNQFTNANAQQGNVLLGQGIRQGNAFGGDRAGVAAAQMANQQQLAQAPVIAGLYNTGYNTALGEFNTQNALAAQLGQMAMQGQQAGAQLGMQGYGLGLNASSQANALAAQALAQNQNAALQGGSMLGQLGGLQYSQNLAGGAQANQAAQIYPAYLQNLYATQAANAQMANAYPFQTSSWYGGLLQGIGGLTGTQQSNVNSALSNYLQNQQGTQLINGTGSTTPPQPNSFLQAAGLGLAGLGLFAKRGGSVPPRMPHRAMGGGIPRYAAGGPAGGRPGMGGPDLNFLTGGFGEAIQPRALQATHLAAPNTTATDIKLPVLSTLTFPGMSTQNPGPAASGSPTGATQGLIGQATNLLGNKQVASGIKSLGSSLFGNDDVSVAALGGGSVVGTEPSGGPNPLFRRGGTVAMRHYPSGGFVPDPYADNPDVDEEEESADTGLGNWVDSLVRSIPNTVAADEDLPEGWTAPEDSGETPMPRPRPRDDAAPETEAPDTWTAPEGSGGQPEAANVGLPELANDEPVPDAMTTEARGQPERQAGIGTPRPQRGGRGRPERIDFPGQQRAPQGFLSRWASNPLTQFGLGLASAKGAGMTGVAEGLAMGLNRVQAQQIANDKLDKNYKLDTSGDTTRLVFPTHAIDTKLPTGRAKLAQQQRMGKIPAGMMMGDDGVLKPMPGLPPKATAQGGVDTSKYGRPPAGHFYNDQGELQKVKKAAGEEEADVDKPMDDDNAREIAERAFDSGNRMEMATGGTGKVAAANRAKVNRFLKVLTEERAAAHGTTVEEERKAYAERQAQWEGRKAASRTLANTEVRMGVPAEEARNAIGFARGAIEKVPRTSFLPINRLIEGYANQTLDPDQKELYVRTQAVINSYASVMSRGAAVTTDHSRGRAEELLQTANNPEAYNRVLKTLATEIDMARKAPMQMREMYSKMYGATALKPFEIEPTWKEDAPTAAGAPITDAPTARPRAKNPKTGAEVEWDGKDWVPVGQ